VKSCILLDVLTLNPEHKIDKDDISSSPPKWFARVGMKGRINPKYPRPINVLYEKHVIYIYRRYLSR
jgi:hypothetical protein